METETTYDTTEGEVRDWVLFSGGHDSLVAAHYLMENGSETDEAYWAHGKLSDSDKTYLKTMREPEDMMLCRDYRVANQNPGSDTDW